MSKILITGGTGFIGKNLVERTLAEGHEVNVLDREIKKIHNNEIRVIQGDIRKKKDIEKAIKDIEVVYHLAAKTNVIESFKDPISHNDINIGGTLNILNASINKKIKIVYPSTAAIYGNPRTNPIDETHPINPLSPYGISKLTGELYCDMYRKKFGIDCEIFRLFNVYGIKTEKDGKDVITKFITKVNKKEAPVIYGDGNQTRDFIHVNDVIDVFIKSMNIETGNIYNLGSGKSTSLNDLANILMNERGMKGIKPEYKETREGEIIVSVANISKLEKNYGWSPTTNIEDGIRKIISRAK